MNFKKIFTIMIVLFIALGVSGVNASDIIDDDTIVSTDAVDAIAIDNNDGAIAIDESEASGDIQTDESNSTVNNNGTGSNVTGNATGNGTNNATGSNVTGNATGNGTNNGTGSNVTGNATGNATGNGTGSNTTNNTTVLESTEIVADNVVYKINDEKKYNVTLLSNGTPVANQNITFIINNAEEYNTTTNDKGVATLDISFLKVGDYDISIKYGGNDQYNASVAQSIIKIFNTIEADNVVKYFKNGTQFEATLYNSTGDPIANEKATIEINGETYSRTTKANGSIVFAINLNPGNYTLKITNPVTKETLTKLITVLPVISGEDIELYYKNGTKYTATFLDGEGNPLSGSFVQFNINGEFYNRTTKDNGTASITINLNPGNYIITSIVPANGAMASNNIKVLPVISGEDIELYWQNGTKYTATFLDGEGNPLNGSFVQFNINGEFYNRTTKDNGTASITINLYPGTYIITAINPLNGAMASNNIKVLSIIDAKDYTKTWNTSGAFTLKTLDKQGNILANQKVDLNINGVIYHRTTNENGSASLNINLIPGTYACTVYYNGLTQGFKVTVNKITPTVAIISSTVKKGDNYKCKISYNGNPIEGLRVYYIINPSASDQQVFAYRTDAQGIASAPIQLPVGKYQFAIGIQDETFYSNVFLQTTLNVVE